MPLTLCISKSFSSTLISVPKFFINSSKINSEICYDEIDKLIGDITEHIYLENGLVAIIDETGKSKNLTANRYITNSKGYKQLIAGRIILAGLNNTQIDIYSDLWKTPEIIDQKEVIKLVWCNF